ncbi:hypothetical protein LNP74_29605 [Klebsiella pneumoniae subsp. pneumoniae]|nr:hypothetical protein [Klebsiella pneumoniae subsp. pneumoniae]
MSRQASVRSPCAPFIWVVLDHCGILRRQAAQGKRERSASAIIGCAAATNRDRPAHSGIAA